MKMHETAKVISGNLSDTTALGVAYYEALARDRAKADEVSDVFDGTDVSVPKAYQQVYRDAYDKVRYEKSTETDHA